MICHREIFSQTRSLLESVFTRYSVSVTFVDANDIGAMTSALRPNTRLIYIETPSNPSLNVIGIAGLAEFSRNRGILLVVDSTNATPVLQRPLEMGANLVIHSGTKFIAGHSDVLCGVIVGDTEWISKARTVQKLTGGVLDPHAAYFVYRGLQTLPLRMHQICETSTRLSQFLADRQEMAYVRYPFLATDPGHAIALKQMKGGGGLISFELKGGLQDARRFLNALKVIQIATSLGGTHSTIEIPYELKRIRQDPEEQMGLIRLSVGIEPLELLRTDLLQALQSLNP